MAKRDPDRQRQDSLVNHKARKATRLFFIAIPPNLRHNKHKPKGGRPNSHIQNRNNTVLVQTDLRSHVFCFACFGLSLFFRALCTKSQCRIVAANPRCRVLASLR